MSGSRQLNLPFPQVAVPPRLGESQRLRLQLESRLGERVKLTVTDNRHSIVSVRTRPDGVHAVRVHHMFLRADSSTVKQLARYVARRDGRSSRALGKFIAAHRELLTKEPRRPRPIQIRTRGQFFDLQELYDDLNRRCFGGEVRARITWGPARKSRRRRTIRMGTYSVDDQLIRIHPLLDQAFVPRMFIEWVVHHEMLHHVVGVSEEAGRRVFHSDEFRARERAFEHYESARRWEHDNLDRFF